MRHPPAISSATGMTDTADKALCVGPNTIIFVEQETCVSAMLPAVFQRAMIAQTTRYRNLFGERVYKWHPRTP
jgi:hypothetical protein